MQCPHEKIGNCVTNKDSLDVEWSIEQRVQELLEQRTEYVSGFVSGFLCAFIIFSFMHLALASRE